MDLIQPKQFLVSLMAVALGVASLTATDAAAGTRLNANAGGICKAASGPGADVFYFDSQLVQNTSESLQYLTCFIPEMNPDSNRSATSIEVAFRNPTEAEIVFTCVIQAGYYQGEVNNSTFVIPVIPGGNAELYADSSTNPALPFRSSFYSPYTLSCAVPAQGQIGLISVRYPETASP